MSDKKVDSFNKRLFTAAIVGGVAGGIEICITYPTEFVKTQLQLDAKAKAGVPRKFNGSIDCIKKTVVQNGKFNPFALYKGLSPLILFSVPKAAVRFAGFEGAKTGIFGNPKSLPTQQALLCGLVAGALEATFVVCPQETIKVKFIDDINRAQPKYRGLAHGIGSIYRELGFRGLYAGYIPTLLKQSTNQMMRFGTVVTLKNWYKDGNPDKEIPLYLSGLFGAIAGAVSVIGNTPIDVIKTKMQGLEAHKYSGNVDCIKKTYAQEGFKGFYKGTMPRMGRVVADVAIVFFLFDALKPKMTKATDKIWKSAGWD